MKHPFRLFNRLIHPEARISRQRRRAQERAAAKRIRWTAAEQHRRIMAQRRALGRARR